MLFIISDGLDGYNGRNMSLCLGGGGKKLPIDLNLIYFYCNRLIFSCYIWKMFLNEFNVDLIYVRSYFMFCIISDELDRYNGRIIVFIIEYLIMLGAKSF